MKKYNGYMIIGIAAVLVVFAWTTGSMNARTIPDFSLKQLDGSTYHFSDHIGKKVIVIEFWATWCKPCKKLLKKLNQIYLDHKEHVEVLAISIDDASAISKAEAYIKGKRFSFTVLLDPDSKVVRIFNPSMKLPFTAVIDKKGDILHTHTGYIPGYEKEIIKKLETLLHEKN